jgi:hypothetical protein
VHVVRVRLALQSLGRVGTAPSLPLRGQALRLRTLHEALRQERPPGQAPQGPPQERLQLALPNRQGLPGPQGQPPAAGRGLTHDGASSRPRSSPRVPRLRPPPIESDRNVRQESAERRAERTDHYHDEAWPRLKCPIIERPTVCRVTFCTSKARSGKWPTSRHPPPTPLPSDPAKPLRALDCYCLPIKALVIFCKRELLACTLSTRLGRNYLATRRKSHGDLINTSGITANTCYLIMYILNLRDTSILHIKLTNNN